MKKSETRLKPAFLKIILAGIALALALPERANGTGAGFDEPPPPLIIDRLPAKSFGEIFLETGALKRARTDLNFDAELDQLLKQVAVKEPGKLVGAVDELIAQARLLQLQRDVPMGDWLNLLHDARDAFSAKGAVAAEVTRYLRWRLDHKALFGFKPSEKQEIFEPRKKVKVADTELAIDLERMADAATGRAISANWLYARGALGFKAGDRDECQQWFDQVAKTFPGHPRAEIAMFMSARCDFSHARPEFRDGPLDRKYEDPRKKAAAHFSAYLKKYPDGRFVADALGWLGALAFDAEDHLAALAFYIRQAETVGHPETLKSAVFMCERVLSLLVAKPEPDDAAFALVARHPRIAMGLIYHVLNAPESDNENGKYERPAEVKKWRRKILPRIAAQIAKQKSFYKTDDWQPRYLAILALAASEAGNQSEAIELTNLSRGLLEKNDDLVFARGLALQRAGRAKEAIATFRLLLEKFPKSPLGRGIRLRLAVALQDDHQAGAAIVELDRLARGNKEAEEGRWSRSDSMYPESFSALQITRSSVYPDISGAELEQVSGIIDVLENFAPLAELAAALEMREMPKRMQQQLREVIAQRQLAEENFSEARKYVASTAIRTHAAVIEKWTTEAAAARSATEKAEKYFQLGDAWAAARGTLLELPAHPLAVESKDFFAFDFTDLDRRENARALGFKNIDAELEERDELRHASRWWMRAARLWPGSKLAAAARLKALEAIPLLAQTSGYTLQRAVETDAAGLSRQLYEKLRTEFPETIEARCAAYWNFSVPTPEADYNLQPSHWEPSLYLLGERLGTHGYLHSDFQAFAIKDDASHWEGGEGNAESEQAWNRIGVRVRALRGNAGAWKQPDLAAEVEELRKQAQRLPIFLEALSCVNFLDDLTLFFREENLTPEMRNIYVGLRMDVLECSAWPGAPVRPGFSNGVAADEDVRKEIQAALKSPALKPIADYLEFLDLAVVANHRETFVAARVFTEKDGEKTPMEFFTRDYPFLEKASGAFLAKYPKSKKREAAALLLARAMFTQSRPVVYQLRGSAPPRLFHRVPFQQERILAGLDAYDREFPRGRYAAEIRDFRGAVAWRAHDWEKALDLTLTQLNDRTHPDLQPEASLRLANIFGELADEEHRPALMTAMRKRPEAIAKLGEFLVPAPQEDHPLRFLETYLCDQFGIKVVHKKAEEDAPQKSDNEK